MDGNLACLRAEDKALDAYEVANVEQTLEDGIIHGLIFARADVVAGDVDLYSAFGVLYLSERSFSHDASAHQSSCDTYLTLRLIVVEVLAYVRTECVRGILCGRIGFDAHVAQFL